LLEALAVGARLSLSRKPDDYMSQPSGDADGRVACAVVRR
jgi:Cu/Zn superoxide dismutase